MPPKAFLSKLLGGFCRKNFCLSKHDTSLLFAVPFVAYAPFDAPPEDAVVVCVSVEATNEWEWWAPYASNIIFQGIFAKQTYEEAIETLGFSAIKKPVGRQE